MDKIGNNSHKVPTKNIICTIITPDFIDRAFALFYSIKLLTDKFEFLALVTNSTKIRNPEFQILSCEDLGKIDLRAAQIISKYSSNLDALRWSLKPILLLHLLDCYPSAKLLYSDADTCYFKDPSEILEKLDGILLTPHWRTLNPTASPREFRTNFLDGLFNAGCVGASTGGTQALNWWADACIHACEHNYGEGLYADQRYLDVLPVYFPPVTICYDRSYNIADWNRIERLRHKVGTVGMIHFTSNTISSIEKGEDKILKPYLVKYRSYLEMGRYFAKLHGYALRNQNIQPSEQKWDIVSAVKQKLHGESKLSAEKSVRHFLSKLNQATIRLLIVDYDTVFGQHNSITPSAPDQRSVRILSELINDGLTLAVISHRGIKMADYLRATFSIHQHNAIWICCYGATYIERLDLLDSLPPFNDNCIQLWKTLNEILPENEVSRNDHLSAGGQLAIRIRDPMLTERIFNLLHIQINKLKYHSSHISLSPNKRNLFVVIQDEFIEAISSKCGVSDDSEILRIGTFGHESGLDYRLLSNGFSLSCGTVSLSLHTCWNLAPKSTTNRATAYSYLSALKVKRDGIAFLS